MKYKHLILTILIIILNIPVLAQQSSSNNKPLELYTRVERAIYLSGQYGCVYSFSEKIDLESLNKLSWEEKLLLSIEDLKYALKYKENLLRYQYTTALEEYLADAEIELGIELHKQYAASNYSSPELEIRKKQAFEEGIKYYTQVYEQAPYIRKYQTGVKFVQRVIISGDLYKALEMINQFEKSGVEPREYTDHQLLKLKGDIYSLMNLQKEAGIAYEEWINKDNVSRYLVRGSSLYTKLVDLKHQTGHPINILEDASSNDEKEVSVKPKHYSKKRKR